jgi:hypothetical protein
LIITISQFGFYKTLQLLQLEKKQFIFLDNNRAIFNKIVKGNLGMIKFLKFNFYVTSGVTVYFICDYFNKKYFTKLLEEKKLEQNLQRTVTLYNKLF